MFLNPFLASSFQKFEVDVKKKVMEWRRRRRRNAARVWGSD